MMHLNIQCCTFSNRFIHLFSPSEWKNDIMDRGMCGRMDGWMDRWVVRQVGIQICSKKKEKFFSWARISNWIATPEASYSSNPYSAVAADCVEGNDQSGMRGGYLWRAQPFQPFLQDVQHLHCGPVPETRQYDGGLREECETAERRRFVCLHTN